MLIRVVVAALAASACNPHAQLGNDGDDTCVIIDCLQDATACSGGRITTYTGANTDGMCFESWEGVCPEPTNVDCPDGCEIDGARYDGHLGDRLCRAETKEAGDPCPCTTRAVDLGDGTVAQSYLECAGNVCVAADPPVIARWLEPCDWVTPPSDTYNGAQGFCLVACGRTGETIYCVGDWECPEGATCDLVPGEETPVCRPGPRGAPIDLGC